MDFRKLAEANKKRCEESYHPVDEWSEERWALAVAGECGEMCNAVKKFIRGDGNMNDITDEIADTVIYADLLCQKMGMSLEECIKWKFNRTSDKVGSKVRL